MDFGIHTAKESKDNNIQTRFQSFYLFCTTYIFKGHHSDSEKLKSGINCKKKVVCKTLNSI